MTRPWIESWGHIELALFAANPRCILLYFEEVVEAAARLVEKHGAAGMQGTYYSNYTSEIPGHVAMVSFRLSLPPPPLEGDQVKGFSMPLA